MRIVLLDDHEFLSDGLRARLQRAGSDFQVVGEAGSAAEAYAVIAETLPDLVVLDLQLPDAGGPRSLRRFAASGLGARS